MHPSLVPPRRVGIEDAASFAGTTPRAIRLYEQTGLLAGPKRGGDGLSVYGHEEVIRLLWVCRMVDSGVSLDDIRDAFSDSDAAGGGGGRDTPGIPRKMELLSDFVASRLENLPEGSLRPVDLDNLMVMETIFGPLGAAVHASRFIALATQPGLREESDRVDDAEESLDDTIDVDDPRVAGVAAQRHAFELMLHAVIEETGLAEDDEALFEAWDATHPGTGNGVEFEAMSAVEAVGKMPYDFSPARLRCMELVEEIAAARITGTTL